MKRNNFLQIFSVILTMLFIMSCVDEQIVPYNPDRYELQEKLVSNDISYDNISESNPELYSNWENVTTINLNGGLSIDAPWVVKDGNTMAIPLEFRTEIRKEDGWKLLLHTMQRQNSAEPDYIIFYNKYRGIIKGFYYSGGMNNNNFCWVMQVENEASPVSTGTAIFESNTRISSLLEETNCLMTTSNVNKSNYINFGQLNSGWNGFSFELKYGTINASPIISIGGYNATIGSMTHTGKYSGEIVIPSISSTQNGFITAISAVASVGKVVTGGWIGEFIGISPKSIATKAFSAVSSIIGTISGFTKTPGEITYTRCKSSGDISLTGTLHINEAGSVASINNINLKELNDNVALGLWTLSEKPEYTYNKWIFFGRDSESSNHLFGNINLSIKKNIQSLVKINPDIESEILYYTVSSELFGDARPFYNYMYHEMTDDTFWLPKSFEFDLKEYLIYTNGYYKVVNFINEINPPGMYVLEVPVDKLCPGMIFCNIIVEITYKDNSTFISSRNYAVDIKAIDNYSSISSQIQHGMIGVLF